MRPGEKIRVARERQGLSQAELAKRAGISQPAVKKIESGETHKSRHLAKIAQVLAVPLPELDPSLGFDEGPQLEFAEAAQPAGKGRDFPVFASSEGTLGEIVRSATPVELTRRPVPLELVRDAYGLLIAGSSMEPEYRNGDTALVNPHLPAVGGEVYVFYREQSGEAHATIKHLRRSTAEKWFVSQWNPPSGQPQDFTLSRAEWPYCHRVIGKYARR